jgi:hypothetical protein
MQGCGHLPDRGCPRPPRRCRPLDTHEEWTAAERRCFSEASMAMLYPERDDVDAVICELEGADTD